MGTVQTVKMWFEPMSGVHCLVDPVDQLGAFYLDPELLHWYFCLIFCPSIGL